MHLASDYIHPTPHGGRCRVRIFLPDDERDAVMVVCTEPRDNPGSGEARRAAVLVAEVVRGVTLKNEPPTMYLSRR